jgi:hypothetical protein
VVSLTPLPLSPQGKSPRYPFDRRLGGPHNRSGRRGEEKKYPQRQGFFLFAVAQSLYYLVFAQYINVVSIDQELTCFIRFQSFHIFLGLPDG